jgi:Protein of unknown function (DUF3052)
MSSKPTGYSGTSLAKKLGIVEGGHVHLRREPREYLSWLEPLPRGVEFMGRVNELTDIVHVFCERRAELEAELAELRASIRSDAAIWLSWPKKSSKRASDITEDTIRELALPMGFVDVKVCSVSEVWSGMKVVIRKELRR